MSKIGIVGDVTIDLLKVRKEKSRSMESKDEETEQNLEFYDDFDFVEVKGGTLLLAEMIEEAGKTIENKNDIFTYNESDVENYSKNFIHTIATLKKYKSSIDNDCTENEKTYRVNYFDGFNFPVKENKEKFLMELVKKSGEGKLENIDALDMLLIHDHNNYFRNIEKETLESKITYKTNNQTIFIHKMRFPLANGKLWEEIKYKEKLIVIISADDLRDNGLRISRSLSWERTAFNLRRNIDNIRRVDTNDEEIKKLKELFNLKNLYLIIRFETDGAILCKYNPKSYRYEYKLFFDPKVFEGSIENKYPGNMKGLGIAFVTGLVLGIRGNSLDTSINEGIKKGIVASRKLYEIGFKENKKGKLGYPFKDMFPICNNKKEKIQNVEIKDHKKWSIIDRTLEDKNIYQLAHDIVIDGKIQRLEAPVAKFGKLRTSDKNEIESFHSIKNLINEYLNKENTNKPLSIAVFGPPGSGKSFGVTQIAESISEDIEKLEFNLSQLQSPKDLFTAFHMIQSTSLSSKIPLVFFDEFDSTLDKEPYGWLRYFLSPMNDGSFKQGDTIHPIGKCILVFAGGIKKNFKDFDKVNKHKGSDFVSRLRGFIDIKGINCESNDDKHYMIRRALVLRSMLERNVPNIFKESDGEKIAQIDESVLNALINVPQYKHGNRSLEAIIEMSSLSDRKRFSRSALPSSEQLQLHVNKDKFKEYLNKPI